MKKLIFGSLFLAIGVFTSCKKTPLEKQPGIDYSKSKSNSSMPESSLYQINNGLLVFNSVEDFDALIEKASDDLSETLKSLGHISYAGSLSSSEENTIEDQFLGTVLNKDQSIQIGNYIYRINKLSQQVFALHVKSFKYYNDLIAENTANKYVLSFSTEDNVFELLGEVPDLEKAISKNCQSSNENTNGGWQEYANFIDVNNIYGNGTDKRYKFERKLKVRYDNWGIYRKLYTEFKHNEKWYGIFDGTYVSIAYQVQYSVKNGNSGNVTHYPSYPFATSPNYQGTSAYEYFTDNKEIVHYKGTKCLKAYVLKSWCWMRNRQTLVPNLYPNNSCLRIEAGGLGSTYPC